MGIERHTLYLRLPIKVRDAHQIKELHPDIVYVHVPRQKSRRWCTIDFENNEKLQAAKEYLKTQTINGKKIVVKHLRDIVNQKANAEDKELTASTRQ